MIGSTYARTVIYVTSVASRLVQLNDSVGGRRQAEICTGVPKGSIFASLVIMEFSIRTQP